MTNNKFSITLLPENKSFTASRGLTLLEALENAGIYIDAPCGGKGLCGKCKVLVKEGITEPNDTEKDLLTEEEILKGFRLACQSRPVSDTVMMIPVESRVNFKMTYSSWLKGDIRPFSPGFPINSDFKKIFLSLKKPALTDQRSDWERIKEELLQKETEISQTLKTNIETLKKLPHLIREADYHITVTVCENELIDVEKGDTIQLP